MKKVVAFCNTNPQDKFDLTYLKELLPEYFVLTGQETLEKVNSGEILPENIFVIQECNAKTARKLRKKGAISFVNFCWESQMYAGIFYSKLKSIAPEFKHRIYFKGMFDEVKTYDNEQNNYNVFYPGLFEYKLEPKDWKDREFSSIVIGNKYEEQKNIFPFPSKKIGRYLKWLFRLFYETKVQKFMQENELQNKRMEVIEYFGNKGVLEMYGQGWNDLSKLPKTWQNRLQDLIKKIKPQGIEDKIGTISEYKFNFAIENMQYKGYITEKILEALLARTIPVYLGAPDIYNFIPKSCFIHIKDFSSLDELYNYMKNLSPEEAQKYINAGKEFLNSKEAKNYTKEAFCNLLAKLLSN